MLTADGPRTDVTDRTTFAYDAATGNLVSVTDALGKVTALSNHDPHGRPQTITDANGVVTTPAYDARGRQSARSVGAETTGYAYDGVGRRPAYLYRALSAQSGLHSVHCRSHFHVISPGAAEFSGCEVARRR